MGLLQAVCVGVLGTGVPRLACLQPAAWLKGGPVRPIFINTSSRPSRGAKPRRADDRELPQEQAPQAGSRGGGDQGRAPPEGPVTQAMTIRGQVGAARAPACAVSLFPFRCKGGKHRTKASGKGYRFGATRPRPAERQDGGHREAQGGVIVRAFGSQRPTLVRISVPDVPLQNGQLLAPFPLIIWGEAQGLAL